MSPVPFGGLVPVTAKLSRRFYEKLGDDVANELVEWFNQVNASYRADLRELNELNFARYEAKLEQLGARVDAKMADLWSELLKWMYLFWVTTLVALIAFRG